MTKSSHQNQTLSCQSQQTLVPSKSNQEGQKPNCLHKGQCDRSTTEEDQEEVEVKPKLKSSSKQKLENFNSNQYNKENLIFVPKFQKVELKRSCFLCIG